MRTTITLEDELLKAAKEEAHRRGTSVSGFIEVALRLALAATVKTSPDPPFELITFGGDGPRPGVDLDRTSAFIDDEDINRLARKRH